MIVSGKSSLDVLKLSTTHATIEQHLVDTKSELALSHDEYSTDLCDKEELCDSSMFIPVPQLVKETVPARASNPSWRPNRCRLRVRFGVQEQSALKQAPRSHTGLNLGVLYMVGKIISRCFQWN